MVVMDAAHLFQLQHQTHTRALWQMLLVTLEVAVLRYIHKL